VGSQATTGDKNLFRSGVSPRRINAFKEVLSMLSSKEKSKGIEKHLKLIAQKWVEDYE
jgi:hypothetical protein